MEHMERDDYFEKIFEGMRELAENPEYTGVYAEEHIRRYTEIGLIQLLKRAAHWQKVARETRE
jgi:hypothetical protein